MNRIDVMVGLCRSEKWRRGAELGVWRGELFFTLLARCSQLSLIGVDRWSRVAGGPKDRETGAQSWADKDMRGAEHHVRQAAAQLGARAVIIKGDTVAAAGQVEDGSLDFVFIDADHATAAVEADIRAWAPKLASGGWFTGHDAHWPSVRRALDSTLPGWSKLAGDVWAIKKTFTPFAEAA